MALQRGESSTPDSILKPLGDSLGLTQVFQEALKNMTGALEVPSKGDSKGGTSADVAEAVNSSAEAIKNAILSALKESSITISEESIQSVGVAVKRGVEEGAPSIAGAIKHATQSTGGGVSGMGAAVRPSEFEALQGRVEILNEKLGEATKGFETKIDEKILTSTNTLKEELRNKWDKNETDMNERFSNINNEVSHTIRDEMMPKIASNSENIDRVNYETKTLQALMHSVLARVERI
jgi:hypothetical protein